MKIDPDEGTADGNPAEYTEDTIKWQEDIGGNRVRNYTLDRTTGVLTTGEPSRNWNAKRGWYDDYIHLDYVCEKGARQF